MSEVTFCYQKYKREEEFLKCHGPLLHVFSKNLGGALFKFMSKVTFFFTKNIRGEEESLKCQGPLPSLCPCSSVQLMIQLVMTLVYGRNKV